MTANDRKPGLVKSTVRRLRRAVAFSLYGAGRTERSFAQVTEQLVRLEEQLATATRRLESAVGSTNARADALEAMTPRVLARADTLENAIVSSNRRIDALEDNVPHIFRRADALETTVAGSNARIDTLEATASQIQAQAGRLESRLVASNRRIDDLDARLYTGNGALVLASAVLALERGPRVNETALSIPLPPLPQAPVVSVIINTCDRGRSLELTLRALLYQRYRQFEVIVVNGPSGDDTDAMLERDWQGRVRILQCPDRNLARSRNIGISAAGGDILAFLDDDAIPEPDWLEEIVAFYDNDRVGAVGGYARDRSGVAWQVQRIQLDRMGDATINLPEEAPYGPYSANFPSMLGANSSFRRVAVAALGGFDERYSFWLEEGDLVARMVDAKLLVRQNPEAEVHHAVAPSTRRDEKGRTTNWFDIARSRTFFALANALPGDDLTRLFLPMAERYGAVASFLAAERTAGNIDEKMYRRLSGELRDGTAAGIAAALGEEGRRTVRFADEPPPPLMFVPLLPAGKRLRLAFVTGLYPPRAPGGVAVFIRHLAMQMAAQGHEITIITFAEPGSPHEVRFEDGIWVHRLPLDRDLPDMEIPAGLPELPPLRKHAALAVLAELDRVNGRRRFDLVAGALWDVDVAAVAASGRYPVAVWLVTGTAAVAASAGTSDETSIMLAAEAWLLRKADRLIASTNAIRDAAGSASGLDLSTDTRVAVIPFGIPETRFTLPEADRTQDEGIQLLFAGRFELRKGIDVLLDVLPALLERHPDLRVTLAGDNTLPGPEGIPFMEKFQEKWGDQPWMARLDVPGVVDDDTLEKLVASCDVFVAPSRYESFGLIYPEAMRYGKPVIGCRAGGTPEVVSNDNDGILVESGDAASLAAAMERLISDGALRQRLGEAGRARYLADFTVRRFAGRIEDLFSAAVSKSGQE